MTYEVDVSSTCKSDEIDLPRLRKAVKHGLAVENVDRAVLSITVVDNAEIHRLNALHLKHDYPTDVISFQLEWTHDVASPDVRGQLSMDRAAGARIEGEIVVSWEYAAEMAARCGWGLQDELTLYAIHGMLHICGYDDLTPSEKDIMRSREQAILKGLDLHPSYPDDIAPDDDEPPPKTSPSANHDRGAG